MKKLYLFILIIQTFISCAGVENKSTTVFYEDIPENTTIYLRNVKIMPEIVLQNVSGELPELIKSCLVNSGFNSAEKDSDSIYILDIFINSSNYQYQYKPIESVTISMRFYKNDKLTAYRVYTEDTEKGIGSFSWTLDFIERNIHELALITGNEK